MPNPERQVRPAEPSAGEDDPSWFDVLPSALLSLDARGRVLAANAAARSLLGAAAAVGADPLASLGVGLDALPADPVAWPGSDRWLSLRATPPVGVQRLLQVEDATELVRVRQAVQRQRELLDLAQQFGRMGVWERELPTLAGRWDRHVYKFWGLDDDAGAPEFEAATQQIVEADRGPLEAAFRESLRQAGTYAFRYRVRRRDGQLTQLHSQWAVKNGADGRPDRVIGIMMDDTEAMQLARSHLELESQLALAGALAGLVVWRHDLRTDRIRFNELGYQLLDLPALPEGAPIEQVRARLHPEDVAAARAGTDAALSGQGPADLVLRYARTGGGWRRMLSRQVAQSNDRGERVALLGVALDITDRDEQLRRARELSDRFDLAARTAGIGYWSREGDADRAYWSDQMRALHGLADADPVPTLKEWFDRHAHPDDREAIRQQFRDWLEGRVPRLQAELRVLRKDGSVRHLRVHSLRERGGPVPVLFGIAVDITERRLADLALRRADERAALAARGAGIGTWEIDRREGATFWDEQMWRLRGHPPRELAASVEEMMSYVHPDDRDVMAGAVARALDDDALQEHSFRVVRPDGTVRWLASRSTSVRDRDGRAVRRIGVNWDVTAAREAEAERSERLAAEQAHQAKNRFLARMSHELRTPLNAVLGFADLLLADDDADRRAERVQHIRHAGRHLLSLIDDVLDLASLGTGELRIVSESVELGPLLADTLPLLETLREQRDLATRCDVAGIVVRGDTVRLRQVLINLLSNAYKYNRVGGRVDIRARARGERALISIEDSGRGMSPAQLRQLYQPFNRLGIEREGIEGTGIGLTIVKALVEGMGGTLRLRSRAEHGTRAEIELPLAAPAPAAPAPLADGRPSAAAGGTLDARRGLLYIEDNTVNTLIVRELLRQRPDIPLHVAGTGAEGVQTARRERPALVLLDMQLPDADGLTVLARLRDDPATADLPCIAVSANAQPEDIAAALAAGMADYWTKPLDLGAFLCAIDALFGPAVASDRSD